MKKVICILSLLLISTISWSQSVQETIATFVIREASLNNEDITPIALDASQYLVFYTIENEKETYLANVWKSTDNQVYGKIYNVEVNEIEETSTSYRSQEFTFSWRYAYDQENSTIKTANVYLSKIHKPNGITYVMKIVDADLDVFIYKGFMQGSFDIK